MDSVLREVWNVAEERYDDINISPFTRHLMGSVYHTSSVLYDPLRIFNSTKHMTVSTPSSQNMYWTSLQHLSLQQSGNSSSLVTECMSTPACITETANYTSHSPIRLQWVHSHKFTLFHSTISCCCRYCPSTFLASPPPVRADVFPHVPTTFTSLLWSTRLSSSIREVMEGGFQVPVFLPPYDLF
jgi:hypothetical protein